MEHFEYVRALVGIDHVGFGPDTVYGDHVGLHRVYASALSIEESRGAPKPDQEYDEVEYVEGLENPTEGSHNIVRWLVKHGYSDEDIEKALTGLTELIETETSDNQLAKLYRKRAELLERKRDYAGAVVAFEKHLELEMERLLGS